MGTEVTAVITDTAQARHAQQTITGKSFKVVGFVLGSEGHDPLDPLVALTPDPTLTEIPGQVFGEESVDGSGYLTTTCPYWTCILEFSEAVGASVSSLGLIAEIVFNGDDPIDEIGDHFLYAVANTPLNVKTSNDRYTFTVGIQL